MFFRGGKRSCRWKVGEEGQDAGKSPNGRSSRFKGGKAMKQTYAKKVDETRNGRGKKKNQEKAFEKKTMVTNESEGKGPLTKKKKNSASKEGVKGEHQWKRCEVRPKKVLKKSAGRFQRDP